MCYFFDEDVLTKLSIFDESFYQFFHSHAGLDRLSWRVQRKGNPFFLLFFFEGGWEGAETNLVIKTTTRWRV